MTGVLFALGGALTGIAQARLMGHRGKLGPGPWGMYVRLMLVAGLLLTAAVTGHLLAGASGWLVGFVASSVVVYRRLG